MAGFGRKVKQVETIDEIQAGLCLRSLNLLGHEDIRKVVVVQTEEDCFLIDTNVTLYPEKTKLDYDVHPMYRMNLHDIYHVGYFTIEKKTFIDFDFKISESDTLFINFLERQK
jgi:hypothetical protein